MSAPHPLDPLTAAEFRQVVAVLRRDRGVGAGWRFASIELAEPPKDALRQLTEGTFHILTEWLARKPFVALDNARDWSRILAVLAWFCNHPNSGLYLRQLDIEGVDTKFIESRKALLADLD